MQLESHEIPLIVFILALATLMALGYDSNLERIFIGGATAWFAGSQGLKKRRKKKGK